LERFCQKLFGAGQEEAAFDKRALREYRAAPGGRDFAIEELRSDDDDIPDLAPRIPPLLAAARMGKREVVEVPGIEADARGE
jgi:hypothetical protein